MEDRTDFTVECNCCKQWLDNWIGSTPCCGSIAYRVDIKTGEVSDKSVFFSNLGVVEVDFTDYQDINKMVDDNFFDLI